MKQCSVHYGGTKTDNCGLQPHRPEIDGIVQLVHKLNSFKEENGFLASVLQDFQVANLFTPSRPSIHLLDLFGNIPYID